MVQVLVLTVANLTRVPPNVIFQVDDMEQDWTFRHRFDYIFARYLACSLKDYKAVIRRAFE